MSDLTITEADVQSFRDKLDDWAATLSDGEQAILAMVATRAFPDAAGDDVQGFDGHVAMQDFHFVKKVDKSSAKLFAAPSLESMVGMHFTIEMPGTSLG
jgi:hypothetical protein